MKYLSALFLASLCITNNSILATEHEFNQGIEDIINQILTDIQNVDEAPKPVDNNAINAPYALDQTMAQESISKNVLETFKQKTNNTYIHVQNNMKSCTIRLFSIAAVTYEKIKYYIKTIVQLQQKNSSL